VEVEVMAMELQSMHMVDKDYIDAFDVDVDANNPDGDEEEDSLDGMDAVFNHHLL